MKYAIFRGKVGLYSWRYIDSVKDLKDYPYIKKESLPVLVNKMGGYHSFSKNEPGFLEIRKVADDKEPLTREERFPKNSSEFEYGWIDPEGNTYNTGYEGHHSCAYCLLKELGIETFMPERKLEEMGFVKITRLLGKTVVLANDLFVTKNQADTLFDLGLYDLDDVKLLIHCSEAKW